MKTTIILSTILTAALFILPIQAHADWSVSGMRPIQTPNINPPQQPLNHQARVIVAANHQPARVQVTHHQAPAVKHPINVERPKLPQQARASGRDYFQKQDHYRDHDNYFVNTIVTPAVDQNDGYETVMVDGQTYFYSDGNFYQQVDGQLVAVPSVFGAIVDHIPQDYQIVSANGINYFYTMGAYYQRLVQGFQVVAGPGSDQG